MQLQQIDHASVNTSVNQINKSCTGCNTLHTAPALLPGRAPGHREGSLSLGTLVLALSSLPSLRSLLGPRRGLVQALEAVAGQPLQHGEVMRSGGQKVKRSGGHQSHLTSRGLLLVGPGGCAAVGGGERGVGAGGHLAHLNTGVINSWRPQPQLLSAVIDNSL